MMVVSLEQVKAGMVLAEPVRNHQNMLLLEAGKKISARAIRIFKSWGVTQITVRSRKSKSAHSSQYDVMPAAGDIEMQLKKKFAESLDDPVMVTIMEAAGRILSRQLEKKTIEP